MLTTLSDPIRHRAADVIGSLQTLTDAGVLNVLRPDKYLRIAQVMAREGRSATVGIAMSARRCPERIGLIDELGELTFRQLDCRADALATALQKVPGHLPQSVAIMCRNHRGFVDALAAANRIGVDVLLLNTSFAGPALAEVVSRERPDVIIFDEEFASSVNTAVAELPGIEPIVAWTDAPDEHAVTVNSLIEAYAGQRPAPRTRDGKLVLLTSGTTGTPKGARRSGGGGPRELTAVLRAVPWHTEEPIMLAAPMFHAWGYGQLVLATLLSCTLIITRKFDPERVLELVDRHEATGLSVVPVMLDRILDLPDGVRRRYDGRSLRFVTASGSRMRPDVVTRFMDEFGDVVYNNYNATEVGMIAAAGPPDLRANPETAGRPLLGVDIRILDEDFDERPTGETGRIFAKTATPFDGYTSGTTKDFHDGYMASGDLGYFDADGRLFVVGRDDEMIVSGGENVYPIEVERVLAAHADVAEAVVLGVDDQQFGQRLTAFVVLGPGGAAGSDDLKQHVRESLAPFKVPREITVLDELPRNTTGKILRRELLQRSSRPDGTGTPTG